MNDSSPEPRDPWAPPERPAVDLGTSKAGHGAPGVSGPQPVPDRPTPGGHPGERTAAAAPGNAAPPTPPAGGPPPAAYGHPVAPPGYGYPGDAGYPGYPAAQQGYPYSAHQTGYPYPGAYPPYGRRPSNGFGVTALVLGILAVVGCVTSFLAVALGIGAVVFGALGKGKANRGEADNGGVALAGIILGAIGIVLGLLMLFALFAPAFDDEWGDSPKRETSSSDSRLRERV
ncbi:DUF4190 domain-containing protein [Streptomyces sp. PCS3-D2]|uniref:DUF4190 domain-containing protein n=1 Tax=Streptomyces sp. PCS3-D2 TaxID=1460244 RepID=UPI00044C53F3|nr:DUF4190 domain-containing protein [Streptomyces sp. PCS3-D2]WKV71600.1 DUF4190 domain-containing protein [Streptomyces sp. PCS3-D2]